MSRIIVKYNNRTVTSYKCPTTKVEEGLVWLNKRYPNCAFVVC